ncbi:hypothetical protein BJ742DRAFT_864717 [Cladochytrium replicatum]|nr:hypothetical protein BJ742DRAFT_864717 [Cladochytrium replicatum]
MSRELPWRDREKCPAKILSRVDQAQQIRMFVVQESGPMAFVVRVSSSTQDQQSEENSTARAKKYKVALGSRQTCSCPAFLTENDLCVHIIWVMLKVFRVSPDSDFILQRSILDREAAELMRKRAHHLPGPRDPQLPREKPLKSTLARELVDRRVIAPDDVCPICQDGLATAPADGLSYCRYGCGNNLHVKCLKILVEHQTKVMGLDVIRCPLCRKDFGTLAELKKGVTETFQPVPEKPGRKPRLALHIGGKFTTAYRSWSMLIVLNEQECFAKDAKARRFPEDASGENKWNVSGAITYLPLLEGVLYARISTYAIHVSLPDFTAGSEYSQFTGNSAHAFVGREDRNSKWILAPRAVGPMFPEALIRDMEARDLTDEDYETLLQLQQSGLQHPQGGNGDQHSQLRMVNQGSIPLHIINSFPTFQVSARRDERPVHPCTVCMLPWTVGELARWIPCRHVFHQKCIGKIKYLRVDTKLKECGLAAYSAITMEDSGSDDRAVCAEDEDRPTNLNSPSYKPTNNTRPGRGTNPYTVAENPPIIRTPRASLSDMAIVGSRSSTQTAPTESNRSPFNQSSSPYLRPRIAQTSFQTTLNEFSSWFDVFGVESISSRQTQQTTIEQNQRNTRKTDRSANGPSLVSGTGGNRGPAAWKPTISDESRDQRILDDLLHVSSPWLPQNARPVAAAGTHDNLRRKRGHQLQQMLQNAEARAATLQFTHHNS